MTSINNVAIAKDPHGGLTIGVFDSGVGGLTVLAPLMAKFPNTRFVYLRLSLCIWPITPTCPTGSNPPRYYGNA